jgi:DNA-binding MarR family transcriptional regulator
MVLDEGHRIKNSHGKKNNALRNLAAKHRIILTGTPVQSTLAELWTLLEFVSPDDFAGPPDFLEADVEELTPEMIDLLRKAVAPRLLRRSIAEAERSIAPKEERVVFVSLTPVQRELIRLAKLHKLWRLTGVQTSEEGLDPPKENNTIFKICSHPFLLPAADAFYTKRLCSNGRFSDRGELLMAVSSKFRWLDNVLRVLHRDKHRVLIFSQRVKLLKLLDEFVGLRGYSKEILLGSMTDTEKLDAINRYSNSNLFIFLISTRAGSEGLNLTAADTAIIFDPDWNPQNDLQAQARCHRIGQTHKVDVLRLTTFQTYEHEMFVRAQRKLGLWLTLIGSRNESSQEEEPDRGELQPPPEAAPLTDSRLTLDDALEKTSTVVANFSSKTLPFLSAPLATIPEYSNGQSDEDFIASFPVQADEGKRRTKRSRSREFQIPREIALTIFDRLASFGYGEWEPIGDQIDDHPEEQIHRFCIVVAVLSLRALSPGDVVYFPVLASCILQEEDAHFEYVAFFCGNRSTWLEIFPEGHQLAPDVEAAKRIRAEIWNDPFRYLSVIEMRLVAKCWGAGRRRDAFPWDKIAPPHAESDKRLLHAITSAEDFDPFDIRVQAIIDRMRSDIIKEGRNGDVAYQIGWWAQPEFEAVWRVLMNVPFNPDDFHERTSLLGKSGSEVIQMADVLVRNLNGRSAFTIPNSLHGLSKAPEEFQKVKGINSWVHLNRKDSAEFASRLALIESIRRKESEIPEAEGQTKWGDAQTKEFLRRLLEFGTEQQQDLLVDDRFGFHTFLSKSDRAFIAGTASGRILEESALPDFLFTETDLSEFVTKQATPAVRISLTTMKTRRHPH